ncbi:MAG: hypothetical protein LAO23_13520 [Acidobacteriia bacterium]|nr:hypothetical protein [Terriglobia bacterium]
MLNQIKPRAAVILFLFFGASIACAKENPTADEILQRHLDSIGPASIRVAAKSRVVEGTASYRVLVGGSGRIDGKAVLVSEGRRLHMLLKINAQYTGEQFICDGDKTSVAGTYLDKSRSEFGEFLRSEDVPLREGLLGGELSTAWPLLDLASRKGKLRYQGLKTVDGVDLYAVTYQPKKNTDLEITLLFEPQTFHHVGTIYAVSVHAGLGMSDSGEGASEIESARQNQTRYRIEEKFGDFKTADGLTLPNHYDLRFQQELQNGFTKQVEWEVNVTRVLNNISVDARNFQIH